MIFGARRLLTSVVLLWLVTLVIFICSSLIPGDVAEAIAGPSASTSDIEHLRRQLGLDQNVLTRYGSWLWALMHGDLGASFVDRTSVAHAIAERIAPTASLAVGTLLIGIVLGVSLGLVAAIREGSWVDHAVRGFAAIAVSIPNYWLGIVLVAIFSVSLGWLPVTGYVSPSNGLGEWLSHLILPCLALSWLVAADLARHTRSSMINILRKPYMRTAEMKRLPRRTVLMKHALPNAAPPILATLSLHVIHALGGAVFIEIVFGIYGLGELSVHAVLNRDTPTIQGIALLMAVIVVVINLATDVALALISPRASSL
ncbi:MAG: ABC transporter permease [Lautropia sp.]